MPDVVETFEALAAGTTITAANQTAFDSIVLSGSGASATVVTGSATSGTKGARMARTTGTSGSVQGRDARLTGKASYTVEIDLVFDALPSAVVDFYVVRGLASDGTTAVGVVALGFNASNRLQVKNNAGTAIETWSDVTFDTSTEYLLTVTIETGTSGKYRVVLANKSTGTVIRQYVNDTYAHASGVTMQHDRFGHGANGTFAFSPRANAIRKTWNSTTPTATPPTANAGDDQANVEPYSTVQLTAATSTPGTNPITSYTWGPVSPAGPTLSATSGATPTLYVPATVAGQTYTVPLVVTDGTLTSSDSMTVSVLPAVDTRWLPDGTEVPFEWTSL